MINILIKNKFLALIMTLSVFSIMNSNPNCNKETFLKLLKKVPGYGDDIHFNSMKTLDETCVKQNEIIFRYFIMYSKFMEHFKNTSEEYLSSDFIKSNQYMNICERIVEFFKNNLYIVSIEGKKDHQFFYIDKITKNSSQKDWNFKYQGDCYICNYLVCEKVETRSQICKRFNENKLLNNENPIVSKIINKPHELFTEKMFKSIVTLMDKEQAFSAKEKPSIDSESSTESTRSDISSETRLIAGSIKPASSEAESFELKSPVRSLDNEKIQNISSETRLIAGSIEPASSEAESFELKSSVRSLDNEKIQNNYSKKVLLFAACITICACIVLALNKYLRIKKYSNLDYSRVYNFNTAYKIS